MDRGKLMDFRRIARLRERRARSGFFRHRRGTTTIEFAMVAVPFLGLLTAIFETGFVFFENAQLQEATEAASRALLTNSVQSGISYQTFLNQYVCPRLSTMFTCANLQMAVNVVGGDTSWGAVSASDTQNNIYSGSYNPNTLLPVPAAQQIAVLRVVYPMSQVAGILTGGAFGGGGPIGVMHTGQQFINGNWVNMLMGIYAFQVEP